MTLERNRCLRISKKKKKKKRKAGSERENNMGEGGGSIKSDLCVCQKRFSVFLIGGSAKCI